MTKDNKIAFVRNLTNSIASEIIQNIVSDKVPEEWDGIELRWLLSDKFYFERHDDNRSRKRNYNREVLARNL